MVCELLARVVDLDSGECVLVYIKGEMGMEL